MDQIKTIDRQQLEHMLSDETPDNDDRSDGYALVNVLGKDSFREEHIPNSINIPVGQLDEFEQRFAKSKPIVVYCASPECDASPKAAKALVDRGFVNVFDYANGLSDWKEAGNGVVAGP